jgi:hypothetical protein
LTQSGLEPVLFHNRGKHAHHYTIDVMKSNMNRTNYSDFQANELDELV